MLQIGTKKVTRTGAACAAKVSQIKSIRMAVSTPTASGAAPKHVRSDIGTGRPDFMIRSMWFVYLLRGDIRNGAALDDLEAQHEFVAWWMLWGRAEYPAVWQWDRVQADVAMQLVPVGSDVLCPRLLRRLHESRSDLQQAFSLEDPDDLIEFFCWYRIYGPAELAAAPQLPPACLAMTEHASQRWRWPVPRMAVTLARRVPNLLSADVSNGEDVSQAQAVVDWYENYGRDLVPDPTRAAASAVSKLVRSGKGSRRDGVNLVGFVRGQTGLGEDVRMASAALDAAGIPHVLVDVPASAVTPQQDDSLAHLVTDTLPYWITIYCMSAFDMATLYLARGPAFFVGQYRIGYWPWELPDFPAVWGEVYELVDEIWTGSEFTTQAYRKHCQKTVRRLPCPVALPPVQLARRRDLRLHSPGVFVFVYPFDVNSCIARKNPLGAVRAFRRAFPPGERRVALLLRVNGDPNGSPGWLEVTAESDGDDRIAVLPGTLDRPQALGVIAVCDCLVSPHRAEGFGRNIAEAVLLGIPVLATAFSGCMDFLAPEEGVRYDKLTIKQGDYPFGDGLWWAEPSVDALARRMRRVWCDRKLDQVGVKRRLALRSSAIRQTYSPLATGRAFAKRLRAIGCRVPQKNSGTQGDVQSQGFVQS